MNQILCNLVRLGQANSVNPTNKIETIYFSLTDVKPVLTKMAATSSYLSSERFPFASVFTCPLNIKPDLVRLLPTNQPNFFFSYSIFIAERKIIRPLLLMSVTFAALKSSFPYRCFDRCTETQVFYAKVVIGNFSESRSIDSKG